MKKGKNKSLFFSWFQPTLIIPIELIIQNQTQNC